MTTTMHHPAPQPAGLSSFAVYQDPQDHEPLSPSDMYEEGDSFHSERSFPNDVVHTIELQQQQRAITQQNQFEINSLRNQIQREQLFSTPGRTCAPGMVAC